MSYPRVYQGKALLDALNMSASPQKAVFNPADKGFSSAILKSLLATPHSSVRAVK
jgi:hypothetical protein